MQRVLCSRVSSLVATAAIAGLAGFSLSASAADPRPAAASCIAAILCARDAAEVAPSRWRGLSMHPLVGHVLLLTEVAGASPGRTHLGAFNDLEALDRLASSGHRPVLLLGEQHDNPEHHWLRSILAPRLRDAEKPVGWVFEQLNESQQKAIDAFGAVAAKLPGGTMLAAFKAQVDWAKSGWQHYDYDPLLQAALTARVPIYAGDITREEARSVAKTGEEALTGDERHRLNLDMPLAADLENALEAEIAESHCGMLPKSALRGMALAQRYRDAHLAEATLKAASEAGASVLFAGNGHVRTDRGVPWYIRRMAPEREVLSIMLIEVEKGKTDPLAYVPRDPQGNPATDIVIFTPPAARENPCAAMSKR